MALYLVKHRTNCGAVKTIKDGLADPRISWSARGVLVLGQSFAMEPVGVVNPPVDTSGGSLLEHETVQLIPLVA
jgi:hypothetical protein